jgi:POT family proton-dependent oligopeptide transporter
VSVLVLLVGMALTGIVVIHPEPLADNAKYGISAIGALYFASVFLFGKLNGLEKRRTAVLVILLIASAVFWSGFEQAGSTLNLFAERFTDRVIDVFNFEIPAGWFQSLNPIYIIVFAPVFASLWVALARRHLEPSLPVKFALGLILLGLGFLIMVGASLLVVAGNEVLPVWLIFTYLLHTFGELCLSPVGLSSVTKLAPKRFVGQMMGLWFLATSLGNLIAGLYAQKFTPDQVDQMPSIFLRVVLITGGTGVALLLLARPLKRLMGDVR